MATGNRPDVPRVGFRLVGGNLQPLDMIGVVGFTGLLRQTHGAAADLGAVALAGFENQFTNLLIITKTHAIKQRLVRMPFVPRQQIRDCHTQTDGIHPHQITRLNQPGSLTGIMNTDIGTEQVEGFIVKFGEKLSTRAVFLFFIDIIVTSDTAAPAGRGFQLVILFHIFAQHPLRQIVPLRAKVVDRHGMEGLHHVIGGPGTTATATLDRLQSGSATPFDDVDIDLFDRISQGHFRIGGLGHQRQHVLVPHQAAHAAAAGKALFILTAAQLVFR